MEQTQEVFLLQLLKSLHQVNVSNHKLLNGGKMAFLGPPDLLLRHGHFFPFRPLPDNVKRGPMKQCFKTALNLARRRPDLTYVEGYGVCMIPTSHAWCVDREGFVVDPTWVDRPGCAYFGLPLRTDYAINTVSVSDSWSVLFNWMGDLRLFSGEDSLENAVPKEYFNALDQTRGQGPLPIVPAASL